MTFSFIRLSRRHAWLRWYKLKKNSHAHICTRISAWIRTLLGIWQNNHSFLAQLAIAPKTTPRISTYQSFASIAWKQVNHQIRCPFSCLIFYFLRLSENSTLFWRAEYVTRFPPSPEIKVESKLSRIRVHARCYCVSRMLSSRLEFHRVSISPRRCL